MNGEAVARHGLGEAVAAQLAGRGGEGAGEMADDAMAEANQMVDGEAHAALVVGDD
jgi:hypothetical protein